MEKNTTLKVTESSEVTAKESWDVRNQLNHRLHDLCLADAY